MSQNQHSNKLYLQEMHKLNEAIAYATSPIMMLIFKSIRNKIIDLKAPTDLKSRAQFRAYRREISQIISGTFAINQGLINQELMDKATVDATKYSKILAKRLNKKTFVKPNPEIMKALANTLFTKPNLRFEDASINQMYKSLAKGIATNARKKVSELYMAGKTPHDISLAIAKGFGLSTDEEGLSDKAIKQRAKAFFNTSLSLVREATRAEAERAYEQYISGWEFDAHMDNRTTTGCKEWEGHKFMKESPNETKEQVLIRRGEQDAMVPRHFNCRSIHIVIPYKHNEEWKLIDSAEYEKDGWIWVKETWKREYK